MQTSFQVVALSAENRPVPLLLLAIPEKGTFLSRAQGFEVICMSEDPSWKSPCRVFPNR
jgi:hypothetical protein